MTTFLDALYSLIGMTEDDMNTPGHSIEYEGRTYITPSLIDHDDGKETRSIGEETQRATVRPPRT